MLPLKESLPLIAAGLIAVGGVGYGVREHSQARELTDRQQVMTATIGGLFLRDTKDIDITVESGVEAAQQA